MKLKTYITILVGVILVTGCTSTESISGTRYGNNNKKVLYVSDSNLDEYKSRALTLLTEGGMIENPDGSYHPVLKEKINLSRDVGYTFIPGKQPRIFLTIFILSPKNPDQLEHHVLVEFDAISGEILNTMRVLVYGCFPVGEQ
ncbi:hypothetical protein P3T73_06890 [Kiritimatiellota bacterium B12222]|nr:hypothetical protein P3T73_06890 [Kiritimatiellota bacterium B12222]